LIGISQSLELIAGLSQRQGLPGLAAELETDIGILPGGDFLLGYGKL